VLPAAASLQKQGANKGAISAFLISTPESGIDSIAITYALLDPIMTIVRPVAAFVTAISAGFLENFLHWPSQRDHGAGTAGRSVGSEIPEGRKKHSRQFLTSIWRGLRYAVIDVWGDIALWFYVGLAIAAVITVLVPDALMVNLLGGGLGSMLIMLAMGTPLYICATASTPIAAALILKGVSPGAALVFLLVGPATNITSLSVLYKLLGRKGTFRYLAVLSAAAVLFGLGVDQIYALMDISPTAVIGEAAEIIPEPVKIVSAIVLVIFSLKPIYRQLSKVFAKKPKGPQFIAGFPDLPNTKKQR